MKKILTIFLITIFISCDYSTPQESSKEKSLSKEEVKQLESELSDMFLEFESEKIVLISIIKGHSIEKVKSVLGEYKAKTFLSQDTIDSPKYITRIIDTIAKKNNLSKKMTASIIFSFEYEFITKDEMIDEYTESMRNLH